MPADAANAWGLLTNAVHRALRQAHPVVSNEFQLSLKQLLHEDRNHVVDVLNLFLASLDSSSSKDRFAAIIHIDYLVKRSQRCRERVAKSIRTIAEHTTGCSAFAPLPPPLRWSNALQERSAQIIREWGSRYGATLRSLARCAEFVQSRQTARSGRHGDNVRAQQARDAERQQGHLVRRVWIIQREWESHAATARASLRDVRAGVRVLVPRIETLSGDVGAAPVPQTSARVDASVPAQTLDTAEHSLRDARARIHDSFDVFDDDDVLFDDEVDLQPEASSDRVVGETTADASRRGLFGTSAPITVTIGGSAEIGATVAADARDTLVDYLRGPLLNLVNVREWTTLCLSDLQRFDRTCAARVVGASTAADAAAAAEGLLNSLARLRQRCVRVLAYCGELGIEIPQPRPRVTSGQSTHTPKQRSRFTIYGNGDVPLADASHRLDAETLAPPRASCAGDSDSDSDGNGDGCAEAGSPGARSRSASRADGANGDSSLRAELLREAPYIPFCDELLDWSGEGAAYAARAGLAREHRFLGSSDGSTAAEAVHAQRSRAVISLPVGYVPKRRRVDGDGE